MRTPWTCLFCLVSLLGITNAAVGQDWAKTKLNASPRHQEWVDLKNGSRSVKCFVVYPEVKEKAPVVLLIHEIMGLTDWAMLAADEFAAAGCIVIAPDFVSGLGPNGGRTPDFADVNGVREAISALPADQITGDLNAACEYAKKIPSANGKLIVAGFCWGGGQSFRFAANRSDLSAALVFYGVGPTASADMDRIKCPVYGFYGGNDSRVTATVEDTKKLMETAKKKYEHKVYEGAGHGFMRAGEAPDASDANKKARDSAWGRIVQILRGIR